VGLERVRFLLGRLGNPQNEFRSVHVAGTSGKGSTTTMVGCILQAAGARTGIFRSPHLETYLERICVDGRDISVTDWLACFNETVAVAERMESGGFPAYGLGRPTLFEVLFAVMALHFARTGVEWAAVEAGLGGRLDATNTLTSDVAVVTNVSLEHTQVLGDTVEAIAREKAAILKQGSSGVTAATDGRALAVIDARARAEGVPLRVVGHDVRWEVRSRDLESQTLSLCTAGCAVTVTLPTPAPFQAVNAATAYAAALALQDRGVGVGMSDILAGLSGARVPGRFEVLSRRPLVIVDGAHNPAGMEALAASIDMIAPAGRVVLLFAAMGDKDLPAMARAFGDRAATVVLTRAPGTERAADPVTLKPVFGRSTPDVVVAPEAGAALSLAFGRLQEDDMLVIAGSLYLAGWARRAVGVGGAVTK
jgi:dihydrofolate synthase/folylpolyglutamate synthase